MADNTLRGSGRTSEQLTNAPMHSVFITPPNDRGYTKRLAAFIGRPDIEVVGPEWINNHRWRGRGLTGLVIDHYYAEYQPDRIIDSHLLAGALSCVRIKPTKGPQS